jgi:hypothetical protein
MKAIARGASGKSAFIYLSMIYTCVSD